MNKTQLKNAAVLLLLSIIAILSFSGSVSARPYPECYDRVKDKPMVFTGNYTIYLSRDGSDPVPFGEKYIDLPPLMLDCDPGTMAYMSSVNAGYMAISSEGKQVMVSTYNNPYELFDQGQRNFGFLLGYTSDGNPIQWETYDHDLKINPAAQNLVFHLMITSLNLTEPKQATLTSLSTFDLGIFRIGNGSTGLDFSANVTINTILTSCSVTSAKNIDITWPSLTPTIIDNNETEVKTAPISINCGGIVTPVQLTLTSSGGEYDAPSGLIKSGLDNLGLQITLAKSGNKLPFNRPMSDSLLGDRSYDLNAQLVHVGSGNIPAGQFSTTVTAAFEYR